MGSLVLEDLYNSQSMYHADVTKWIVDSFKILKCIAWPMGSLVLEDLYNSQSIYHDNVTKWIVDSFKILKCIAWPMGSLVLEDLYNSQSIYHDNVTKWIAGSFKILKCITWPMGSLVIEDLYNSQSESLTFAVKPNIIPGAIGVIPRSGCSLRLRPGPSVRSATRDISSDVPVKDDTGRYLNSLKGMI
jgi:hypothetical protein